MTLHRLTKIAICISIFVGADDCLSQTVSGSSDPAPVGSTDEASKKKSNPPSSEKTTSLSKVAKKASTDLSLTREQMVQIFKGDYSSLPNVRTQNQRVDQVRSFDVVGSIGVANSHTPPGPIHVVPDHASPEHGLRVAVAKIEHQIHEQKRALMDAEDEAATEETLKKLADSYRQRFEIDTAFQDFKVSEIERRAKKLRAEVEARENATQQWVDAMVTLAKMKAAGIQTMDTPPIGVTTMYPSAPTADLFVPKQSLPAPPVPYTGNFPADDVATPPTFGEPPRSKGAFQPVDSGNLPLPTPSSF